MKSFIQVIFAVCLFTASASAQIINDNPLYVRVSNVSDKVAADHLQLVGYLCGNDAEGKTACLQIGTILSVAADEIAGLERLLNLEAVSEFSKKHTEYQRLGFGIASRSNNGSLVIISKVPSVFRSEVALFKSMSLDIELTSGESIGVEVFNSQIIGTKNN